MSWSGVGRQSVCLLTYHWAEVSGLSRGAARDNVRVLFLIRFLGSDLFLYFLNLNSKSLT